MPRWVQPVPANAAAGPQPWFAADWMQAPFACSWSLEGLSGVTGTYNVETTMDDVNAVASPEVNTVLKNATADATGVIGPGPVWGIRINFTSGPVGGVATFRITQGMTAR